MLYHLSKRVFDVVLVLLLAVPLTVVMLIVAVAVKLTSRGSVLYFSKRVGGHRRIFMMAKVRTMRTDTPQVATHLMTNPEDYLTVIGGFLRKTSLDEIPQILNILNNDMSFVGPRPALFNQDDLIELREKVGINTLKPGLTGWAQVTGRDDLPILEKVRREEYYMRNRSFRFDLRILWMTLVSAITGEGVSH